ncbi:hypothetical protein RhiirA1_476443 [Rhizophagus irregularis]|uniref:Uncharacterized protein n=1 Tax=Rhizophagus irregularis TaxID=588596 RepID=A0A2N0QV60_9GLOM|nr:hypothetical protein RhiirA1_476443 [Rhizophagus irregularis]CAB4484691.1 unnamed protein product [Rhizophagus irregularis]
MSSIEPLWRAYSERLDTRKFFCRNFRGKTEHKQLVKHNPSVKNLDLTSVDQVENTVLLEHDSDVILHSSFLFCVTENSEIVINGECCSVDLSKLEYTGYSEKISNLTNNNVQISPSPTIRLPVRKIITKHEMITNENTVYELSSTFNANHAENNISKKDHKESSTHSYLKYKLPPSIVYVNSPLINSPSSVFTNENQSMILCIEPPGNPSSCDTSCDTIVTSLRGSSQTCSQTDSTNSLLFEDALYNKSKKTEVVPMFVDTCVHRENEESFIYYEITKAVPVSSVNLCGHKGNETIFPYYETMWTVPPCSVGSHDSMGIGSVPAILENFRYTIHSWNIHNVKKIFGARFSCPPKSPELITSGHTLLILLVDFIRSTAKNTMYKKLLHFLILTKLSLSIYTHMSKKFGNRITCGQHQKEEYFRMALLSVLVKI